MYNAKKNMQFHNFQKMESIFKYVCLKSMLPMCYQKLYYFSMRIYSGKSYVFGM